MKGIEKLEKDISNIKLNFLDIKSDYVEWGIRIPLFIDTFNMLLDAYKRLPTQKEFVEGYIDEHKEILDSKLSTSDYKALEARLMRSYPSLVRDLHFYTLLKEHKNMFDDFNYSRYNDTEKGVDFSIKYLNKWFYIHCYVGTKRSKKAKKKKDKRKFMKTFTDGYHLDLILNFNDVKTKKVGDFYLYSKKHLVYLKKIMEDIING